MPDNPTVEHDPADDEIEEHAGVTRPDAFEQTTDKTRTIGRHIFADGGDGKEKEVNVLDPVAGASSVAPSNSGIPSAERQDALHGGRGPLGEGTEEQTEARMGDRVEPIRQDLEP